MKILFLDTNVVIDFLADRKPFSAPAAQIFNYAAFNKVKLIIAAVSYNNIYYILRQSATHIQTMKLLDELTELADIADVTKAVIKKSIKTDFKDFEDAIQFNTALTVQSADCIVTRNTKDYKKSSIPVLSPEEALSLIKSSDV